MADLDPARIPELDARLATLAPVDRLRWAYETFGARAGTRLARLFKESVPADEIPVVVGALFEQYA